MGCRNWDFRYLKFKLLYYCILEGTHRKRLYLKRFKWRLTEKKNRNGKIIYFGNSLTNTRRPGVCVAYGSSPKIGLATVVFKFRAVFTVRLELTVLPGAVLLVSSSRWSSARRRRPLSTWATRTAAVPQLAGRYTAATHVHWPQPVGRCMLLRMACAKNARGVQCAARGG